MGNDYFYIQKIIIIYLFLLQETSTDDFNNRCGNGNYPIIQAVADIITPQWNSKVSKHQFSEFNVNTEFGLDFVQPNNNYTIIVEGYTPENEFEFIKPGPKNFVLREF